jgi:ribosomal protein L19E
MQKTENVKNTISSSLKNKIISSEAREQSTQTRGEVAAQEQFRSIQQGMGSKMPSRPPRNRGEVAAQEQIRILNQVLKM